MLLVFVFVLYIIYSRHCHWNLGSQYAYKSQYLSRGFAGFLITFTFTRYVMSWCFSIALVIAIEHNSRLLHLSIKLHVLVLLDHHQAYNTRLKHKCVYKWLFWIWELTDFTVLFWS